MGAVTDPSGNAEEQHLDVALIRALNTELPPGFRIPKPDEAPCNVVTTATKVMATATRVNKGYILMNGKLQRELDDLKKEREETKEQTKETLSMIREREEYRFCVTELLMYITGVKLREEDVDFAILRQVLEKRGRTGNGEGWTLKALGNEINLAFPGKKKITEEEKLAWRAGRSLRRRNDNET